MTIDLKGRLIAVSNRTAADLSARAGGLAVALWETLVQTKGLWIGWSGKLFDFPRSKPRTSVDEGVSFALLDYSKQDYDGFYLGFANSVLWPVLHNRIDLAAFDDSYFEVYDRINRRYAEVVAAEASADDVVWVHDYHFMTVAQHLKREGFAGRTGYFLHIPFPSPDVFRAIPEHKKLGQGLAAYDLIGLQTQKDVTNLIRYFQEEFGAEILKNGQLKIGSHRLQVQHCPIGIDVKTFEKAARSDKGKKAAKRITRILGKRELIIGVDRMDYSKGLPQRFEAMGHLLDHHPELHGTLSYTQITPPSRANVEEYAQLREQLDALAGRINGDYGDLDWLPIRYLARGYERAEIAGIFSRAHVCLVTPLQDGMNLVAKEFIAAQDPQDPGVLILSQFAGAAEQLKDALIINPYDTRAVADAIRRAMTMSMDERKERWGRMYDNICREDIGWWSDRFLTAFAALEPA